MKQALVLLAVFAMVALGTIAAFNGLLAHIDEEEAKTMQRMEAAR